MPEPRSAVLRDLVVAAQHVTVELDGRRILVRADPRSDAYEALRSLHEKIEERVAAGANQTTENTSMFSRAGAFFRSLFSTGYNSGEQTSLLAQRRSVLQDPPQSSVPDPRKQFGHAREIFLDSRGMHVRWSASISARSTEPPPAQSPELLDLTFAPDSPVTEQLHRCFRELAKLGYAVPGVDAAIRSPAICDSKSTDQSVASIRSKDKDSVTSSPGFPPNSAVVEKPGVATAGTAAANGITSQEIVGSAGSESANLAVPNKPQERKSGSRELITMRLRPELPDAPTRGMVASIETPESAEVLVAPELLLRALRASAALPSTSEQRLTFLQCVKNENGLRIVNVGLGGSGEGQPIAWREATEWWQTHGNDLAAAAEASHQEVSEIRPAKLSERTYVCGQSPLGTPAPVSPAGAEMEPPSPTA